MPAGSARQIYDAIRASNFNIYRKVALDTVNISAGDGVTSYFRSAESRISVFT